MTEATTAARGSFIGRVAKRARAALAARTLFSLFVTRELKIRYKRTILGFVWSLVTPLAMAAVFTFVFTVAFKIGIPRFPMFFLAGFLPWSFFAASAQMATGAVVSNAALVRKAAFPTELLPAATVSGNLVHFIAAMVVLGPVIAWPAFKLGVTIPLFVLATVVLAAFALGVALALSALNVIWRDVQEIVPVVFLVWFYATPIVYDLEKIGEPYRSLLLLNPMTAMVTMVRDALFWGVWPSAKLVGAAVATAAVTLVAGYGVFVGMSHRFAREL